MIGKFYSTQIPATLLGLRSMASMSRRADGACHIAETVQSPVQSPDRQQAAPDTVGKQPPRKETRLRFTLTAHPCSLLDMEKLQALHQTHGPALDDVSTLQAHLAFLHAHVDALALQTGSKKPTPQQEARLAAESLSHLVGGYHRLLQQEGPSAVAGLERPESWATRDFDRSGLRFGEMTSGFALQTATMSNKYLSLLDGRKEAEWEPVRALLRQAAGQADRLRELGEQVRDGVIDKAGFASALRGMTESGACIDIERKIMHHLEAFPDDAFTRTFATFRLSGAAGQVRLDGAELLPGHVADGTGTILQELGLLHGLYPDTSSIVIANYKDERQVCALRERLWEQDLPDMSIVPLLEDEHTVERFIAADAKALREMGVERVMLAGSDLPRGAGMTAASIRTTQFMKALDKKGFNAFYFGSGCTPGRSGWGHSPTLLQSWAGQFGNIARRQFTLQGPQHRILFGNDKVGADSLLAMRNAMAKPAAIASEAQIAAVERIFAGLIELEQHQREPDSEFGRFIARHKETLLKTRNAMAISGSRDKLMPSQSYTHVFDDRAINVDFMQRFFRMVDGFTWSDLDAKIMAPQVAEIKKELAAGNPLMQQVLVRMALMSVEMVAPEACRQIWESAGFAPEEIARLDSARCNRLDFLDACGYSLRDNPTLQRIVSETLGTPWHGEQACDKNFAEILRRLETAFGHAANSLSMPAPESRHIVKGLVFTPYKSFGTSGK